MKLVPNRECGDCTACCHNIPINQQDMVKLPNVDCEHLMDGGGCRIYKKRPNTCAEWYCAWRFMDVLGDSWRPDKSGALLDFTTQPTPAEFSSKQALVIKAIDREKFLANPQLAPFIVRLMDRNLPVFISYGLEPGHSAISTFVNHGFSEAVKAGDLDAVKANIVQVLDECEAAPKNILKIVNGRIVSVEPDLAG